MILFRRRKIRRFEVAEVFDHILKFYLKASKKKYLIPFLEGLVNLGQPSTVLFPVELLEQGLGLVLSGLNNTMAAQTNLDWVWPYWLECQQDPGNAAFIPTGVNLLCANLTRRNWTSLGVADSHRESMLDPVGMLTPKAFGWSAFPYLRIKEELYLPPRLHQGVRQFLEEDVHPRVITEYPVDVLQWCSKAMGLMDDGEEMISFAHHLFNPGEAPISFTFGLALRPYNPLTLGHINKLKYKNRLWRVNRKPGLLLLEEPDRVSISDRHLGDPLLLAPGKINETSGTSRSGILAGTCEYDLTLQPGETRIFESLATLARRAQGPKLKFRAISRETVTRARHKAVLSWRDQADQGTRIRVPDARIQNAFFAVKNHLHVFDDLSHFSPGTFFYHGHWFRDSAFIALGFENAGFGDRVTNKLPEFFKRQAGDGFFRSQNGEWDSNGQAVWTIVNHLRRNGDRRLLAQVYPALRKGCNWLENQCRKTRSVNAPHAGLLPPGISAEHFGPNDHYFWDNFWGLAALKSTLWAALKLDRPAEVTRLTAMLEEYRHRVGHALNGALSRTHGDVLPTSPYRNPDSAAIGNLVAVTPLDLYPPDVRWFGPTVSFLMDNNLLDGLFFQKIIHTGLNAYLSVQLARALQVLGDPRWFQIMEGLLRHGGLTYTWPEAIHPGTGGGCMGDGDHGWAASECLSLIRDMMVREQMSELHLAAGIPPQWYERDGDISLHGATTLAGTLAYTIGKHRDSLKLTWEIEPNQLSDRLPLFFLLPPGYSAPGTLPGPGPLRKVRLHHNEGEMLFPPTRRTASGPPKLVTIQ